MSTRADVTVSTVPRTYVPKWHPDYSKELGQGATSVETVDITDGESIIRRTHSVTNSGIEKHYESIEDHVKIDGVTSIRKIGVTMTYESGNPTEEAACVALAAGYLANVGSSTELSSLTSGELRK